MASIAADRTLQYGLLALRTGLIDLDQLRSALRRWAQDNARSLAEHFTELGAPDRDQVALLDGLSSQHLKKHGGDIGKSLDALPVEPSTRGALASLGDPALGTTFPPIVTDSAATLSIGGSDRAGDSAGAPQAGDGRRFRILRPHARGGLGAVFVAMDRELHREVALKQILDQHADDPGSRSRFLLEAEITGGLEHPGIVPVYGLGIDADGRPFYAMRFIKGDSLKQAIDAFHGTEGLRSDPGRRALGLRKLLRRLTDVCNAVDYAHSRGVLHRDIKPSNIVVGKYGETLVIDWGLAKATGRADAVAGDERPLAPSSSSGSAETAPGSALGTPAYMSPEQASGELERLGPRSDVYSLGATLYCLLTGRQPFEGDVFDVIVAVRRGEFARPRQVDPSIDNALEAVCLKAMAREPEARYATPRDLVEDIERWLADEAVSAWREPFSRRARRWAMRNRTAVSSTAVALVVALGGLLGVAWVQVRANRALSAKNTELTVANAARARALGKADARLGLAFGAIGQFREAVSTNLDVQNRPENGPLRRELLRAPLAFLSTLRDDLRDDPDARLEGRLQLADSQFELARFTGEVGNQDDAQAAAAAAAASFETMAGTELPQAARATVGRQHLEALELLAKLQLVNGRRAEADSTLARGRSVGEALVAAWPGHAEMRVRLARMLSLLAQACSTADRSDEALSVLEEARGRLEPGGAASSDDPEIALLRAKLLEQTADAQSKGGRPAEGLRSLDEAQVILEALVARDPSDVAARAALAGAFFDRAQFRQELGQQADSLVAARQALALRLDIVRDRPSNVADRLRAAEILSTVAQREAELGRSEAGLEALRQARELLEAIRRDNPRNPRILSALATLNATLGRTQYGLGRLDEALKTFEANHLVHLDLVALEPGVPKNHADLAGNEYSQGLLLAGAGRSEESLRSYGSSLARRRQLVAEHPDVARYRFDVAATLGNIAAHWFNGTNDRARAARHYQEATTILEGLVRDYPAVVTYSEYLARSRTNLAATLSELGRNAEALAIARAAEPFAERRVRAEPGVVQHRMDLAFIVTSQGIFSMWLRRADEAERLFRRSLEVLEPIRVATGGNPGVLRRLRSTYNQLGRVELYRGHPADARAWYQRTLDLFEPGPARSAPAEIPDRLHLDAALRGRFRAEAQLGRINEALADWDRISALEEPEEKGRRPLGAILVRAWSGDAAGFLAGARQAVGSGLVPVEEFFTLAEAAAHGASRIGADSAAPASVRTRQGDELAAQAVGWLERAAAAGYFRQFDHKNRLNEPRFDALRLLPSFQALMADEFFPDDPFAGPH
jgi:eukaryotic-like serine/threonine-protein kinase